MNGYVTNIEKLSLENENFRKVVYTDKNSQLIPTKTASWC